VNNASAVNDLESNVAEILVRNAVKNEEEGKKSKLKSRKIKKRLDARKRRVQDSAKKTKKNLIRSNCF